MTGRAGRHAPRPRALSRRFRTLRRPPPASDGAPLRLDGAGCGTAVEDTARHPAVFGYDLIDEPNAALCPGLATVAALVHEVAPGRWAYINLFPNDDSRYAMLVNQDP